MYSKLYPNLGKDLRQCRCLKCHEPGVLYHMPGDGGGCRVVLSCSHSPTSEGPEIPLLTEEEFCRIAEVGR